MITMFSSQFSQRNKNNFNIFHLKKVPYLEVLANAEKVICKAILESG